LGECNEQERPQAPTASAAEHCQQKKNMNMKIPELLQLFTQLTGQQLRLPKKTRKPDITSRISEIAILRSE